jgi:hypothetical protein
MPVRTKRVQLTVSDPRIEATQRGYVVTVKVKGKSRRGDLAYYHDAGGRRAKQAYRDAVATAESVKRGRWVGRRNGWTCVLHGRQLTCER